MAQPRNAETLRESRPGLRSGLEDQASDQLASQSVPFDYEKHPVMYVAPSRIAAYRPDFLLRRNGVIVETKGRFEAADREKHLLIRAQHPELDIRFVFSRSKTPIRPGSPITYADWCVTHGFKFADRVIPQAWIDETPCDQRLGAVARAVSPPPQRDWALFKPAQRRS